MSDSIRQKLNDYCVVHDKISDLALREYAENKLEAFIQINKAQSFVLVSLTPTGSGKGEIHACTTILCADPSPLISELRLLADKLEKTVEASMKRRKEARDGS